MVWINEGAVLTDAGHLIVTLFSDLRKPEDRTPITGLVRGCERKFALEECETIMISKPARYRSYGEELILDVQEGLAIEKSVIVSKETTAEASRRRAISDTNQALELSESSMRPYYRGSQNNTKRYSESIAYAKEWWILSTSIRPDRDQRLLPSIAQRAGPVDDAGRSRRRDRGVRRQGANKEHPMKGWYAWRLSAVPQALLFISDPAAVDAEATQRRRASVSQTVASLCPSPLGMR